MENRFVLLAGYGSIGKKYAALLIKKKFKPVIFDPKILSIKNNNIIFLKNNKKLSAEIKKRKIKIGIISSLSDSHYKNLLFFVKNGISKILIEKPVTNNLKHYRKIIDIKKNKKLFVSTHFKWGAINLSTIIKKIEKKNNLGTSFQFVSEGGANCLATGGIHWIDFFIKHFQIYDDQIEILSNLSLDKINPRSKFFYNIGGSFILKHKRKGTAILTYNNQSRLAPLQTLTYKCHSLKFDILGNYKIYRTEKKLDKLKITRYGVPKLIKEGNFLKNKKDSIEIVLNNLLRDKNPLISLEKSIKSFKILTAVLISDKIKRLINFKMFNKIIKKEKFLNKKLNFT